jgi:hypothetical protein
LAPAAFLMAAFFAGAVFFAAAAVLVEPTV